MARSELFERLIERFDESLDVWRAGQAFDRIRAAWLDCAVGLGERIAIQNGAGKREGVFEGIDAAVACSCAPSTGSRASRRPTSRSRLAWTLPPAPAVFVRFSSAGRPSLMTDDNEFVFAPLGGLGEIGMNCALYGYGPANARKWLMVDLGVGFADEDLPGVDLLMPDLGFIEKAKKDLVGIVITHAHEDHIGALAELWPRPRRAGLYDALSRPGSPRRAGSASRARPRFR